MGLMVYLISAAINLSWGGNSFIEYHHLARSEEESVDNGKMSKMWPERTAMALARGHIFNVAPFLEARRGAPPDRQTDAWPDGRTDGRTDR